MRVGGQCWLHNYYLHRKCIIENYPLYPTEEEYPHKTFFEGYPEHEKYKGFIVAWNSLRIEENQKISILNNYPQELPQ